MIRPVFSATHSARLEQVSQQDTTRRRQTNGRHNYFVEPDHVESNDDGRHLEDSTHAVNSEPFSSSHDQDSKRNGFSVSPPSHSIMAAKTHAWISLWFLITVPVIFWDVGYCFMRPRSMVGGDLHWIWKPYEIYQEVDLVYGIKALTDGDGFTNAQSLLNLVENLMNIGYLYLAHVVGTPVAPLLGFASAVMTLSKTVLYWAQEYYCGGCAVGHNSMQDLIIYWIIPNGFWLVVPSAIIWQFSKDITSSLRFADNATRKEVSGKTQ